MSELRLLSEIRRNGLPDRGKSRLGTSAILERNIWREIGALSLPIERTFIHSLLFFAEACIHSLLPINLSKISGGLSKTGISKNLFPSPTILVKISLVDIIHGYTFTSFVTIRRECWVRAHKVTPNHPHTKYVSSPYSDNRILLYF